MPKRLFIALFLFCIAVPFYSKTVKVGYYIDSGNFMSGFSENDPKAGFAYEYLQTIAAYTGWNYEYVYGEWDELYDALLTGRIDLLSDVSYTKDRENLILYPNYPMGEEAFYLYSNNQDLNISAGDYAFWAGKKIGLRTDCNHYDIFLQWAKNRNLNCEYVEFTSSAPYFDMFENHEFDILLEIDMVADPSWNPIEKVGAADFFLAVTKNRPDILNELNSALAEIFAMNPYYNNNLWLKYFSNMTISKNISEREAEWLIQHPEIRVGCLNDDLPFSNFDIDDGKPEGFIVEIMNYMETHFLHFDNSIKYVFYTDTKQMIADFKEGKLEVLAPAYRNLQSIERNGNCLSEEFLSVSVGLAYKNEFDKLNGKTIAISENLRSYYYIKDYFPYSEPIIFNTIEECLQAVLDGRADACISNTYKLHGAINNNKRFKKLEYRELPYYNNLACICSKTNTPLISLINKTLMIIPDEYIDSVMDFYTSKVQSYTRSNFFQDYFIVIILVLAFILLISFALLLSLRHIWILTGYDTLTHLQNRRHLDSYITKAMKRADDKDEPFSLLLFDLDDFKALNDTYGHAFGDKVLQTVAAKIENGISAKDTAFRWGGEEFLVICKKAGEEARKLAEKIRMEIEKIILEVDGTKVGITTTIGVSAYEKNDTYKKLFQRADNNLYKGKENGKNQAVL
jgi:diguanylate cyclase (GGDEF)-like protein